jgi:hypothetical protein
MCGGEIWVVPGSTAPGLWEVVEVDKSTKLAKYTRAAADSDADRGGASGAAKVEDEEGLEEITAAQATATALLAIETSEVSVEELHALLGSWEATTKSPCVLLLVASC